MKKEIEISYKEKEIIKKSLKNQVHVLENAITSCKNREQTDDMVKHITKLMTEIDALDTLLKQL